MDERPGGRNRRRAAAAAACVALLAVATYWPSLGDEFVALDDAPRIYDNPHVQHLSWETVRWAFSQDATRLYVQQPLTWLSFAVEWAVFGGDAAGFHAVSLALHAAVAVLLLLLLWRTTDRLPASAAAAAIFAVHPLTVEPVAWATERNTLLAAVFGLAAAHAWVGYARRPSAPRYGAVLLAFAASLAAKPWLFGLPLVLLALDLWPLRRAAEAGGAGPRATPRRLVLEKLPLVALAGAWALLAMRTMERAPSALSAASAARPLASRVGYAAVAAVRYLGKLVAPVDLAVHYPYPDRVPGWQIAGAVAIAAAITGAAIALRRRAPSLLLGWAWFLVLAAPTLGIVQAGTWPAIADRFAYVPMIGLVVAAAFAAPAVEVRAARARIALALTAALVAALAVASRAQLRYWHDTVALLSHAEAVAPGSPLVETLLGHELGRLGRLGEAEALLRAGLRGIDTSEAHNDLANVLFLGGRTGEALEEYERALARDPRNAEALYNLGRALEAQGRRAEARRRLLEFLRVAPPALDEVKRQVEAMLRLQAE